MKAIINTRYGPPERLELREVDPPVPEDGDVLVRVRCSSVNDWDLGLTRGWPRALRPIFDTAPFTVAGTPEGDAAAKVWVADPEGVLAMDGKVGFGN